VKFFLFLAILAGLAQLFSFIPRQRCHEKNGDYWPYFFQEQPENSVDIIYMGSSHSNSTFIPEIIDDILNVQSIHVNTSGESIYQTAVEYQEVLRHQNPKMVVIETYPIYDGLSQEELKPWNYSFFFAVPSVLRQISYAHHFFSADNLVYYYLPYTIFHANWKELGDVAERVVERVGMLKAAENALELPHQGYFNYLESLPPLEAGASSIDVPAECPLSDLEERLAATKDLIELDKQTEESLVFIEAPQLLNDFEACRTEVIQQIESYGGDYAVLLQDQARPRLWFGDHEHMTQFGALVASVELAELLADRLGIPLDEQALAFYRSYFFKDYTLTRSGSQVNVKLMPYDDELSSNLYFKWTLYQNDEPLDVSEGTNQNKLTVNLPEAEGTYYLDVMIYNLSGGYSLRGRFNVPGE